MQRMAPNTTTGFASAPSPVPYIVISAPEDTARAVDGPQRGGSAAPIRRIRPAHASLQLPSSPRPWATISRCPTMQIPPDALRAIDFQTNDPFRLDSLAQCIARQQNAGLPYIYAEIKTAPPGRPFAQDGARAQLLLSLVLQNKQSHIRGQPTNGQDYFVDATCRVASADIADIYFYCFTSPTRPGRFVGHLLEMLTDDAQLYVVRNLLGAEKQEPQAMIRSASLFQRGICVSKNKQMAQLLIGTARTILLAEHHA